MTHRVSRRIPALAILVLVSLVLTARADPEGRGGPPERSMGNVESRVDRVLLYSDRALVVRRGRVQVPAGKSAVAFEGLPGKLFDSTVAAAIRGPAASLAQVDNIQVEPRYETTFQNEEAEEAIRELTALRHELRALQDRRSAVLAEAEFARQIKIGARPQGTAQEPRFLPLAPEAWAQVLDFLGERFHSVAERERELAEEMDDLKARIVVAAAKARMLLSYKTELTKRVILEISAREPTKCDLELSYMVPDAGWYPRYDVRANLKLGRIEIVGYGLARQESGEDWTDVELAFSAAEPSRAADLPRLSSWRIRPAQPAITVAGPQQARPGRRRAAQRPDSRVVADKKAEKLRRSVSTIEQELARLSETEGNPAAGAEIRAIDAHSQLSRSARIAGQIEEIERLNERQREARRRKDWQSFHDANYEIQKRLGRLEPAQQEQFGKLAAENRDNLRVSLRWLESEKLGRGLVAPVRSSGGYDYRWQSLRRGSVPSDGALTRVVLFRYEFPAEFVYEVAAEKSKLAFLRTRLRNTTRSPFLAGPVSVFLGADFVGESRLRTCAPTESFTLGLGADEEIAVTRQAQIKRETRGIFTTDYRFSVDVLTTVRNRKARPVTLIVCERLPYTWDEDLKISEGSFDPEPTGVSRLGERPALLRWRMDLAPGEKREISMRYWFQHGSDRRAVVTEDPSVRW